ncbi:SHOCT domain-containing protein [Natronorubrum tibetense]|uniref:SHOCT domain-containing protein n=1 Tax=Natronorubrum tibetense GA33 TaxID=1114856 RepID=L9W3M9_9EURY|nr:SHOCT domain-containing protein [Natronorubrum tibetense]ELY42943.1 hypothetical protein C496_06402 [Natronorubrum tibetense GA33]
MTQPLTAVVSSAVSMLTVGLALGLLFLGWSNFWIVFVIGFAFVLPAAVQLAQWYETQSSSATHDSQPHTNNEQQRPLETLRERYASGEIDEEEFERRVTRLLETESVADAETFLEDAGEGVDERNLESERNS